MTERCPRCYAELSEDATWVCPTCGYTLRTPVVAKVGILFMLIGLVLLGAYVIGPDAIGLMSGAIPTDLAKLMVANFAPMVAGALAFGMFLTAAGALVVRRARTRAALV
jgi:tellurite resistance protein TehA-like permease